MKRTVWLWQLCGFAVTSLAGTLLHFLYEWTDRAVWAAPFSGINESTWEHMKLLFWPMFLFSIVESFFFLDYENFWCAKLRGMLIGLLAIPTLFYTYNGVIGKSPDFVNIAIFFVSAALSFVYETKLLNDESAKCKYPRLAFAALCAIGLLFVIFTFNTPALGIFKDPLAV